MKYAKFYLPLLFLIIAKISLAPFFQDTSLGSKAHPIHFFLTPSVDAQKATSSGEKITQFLHEKTGYYFDFAVPASFIAVVEAFGSGKADVAGINTFSYILAHKKYGAEAVLKVIRRDGETMYKGQFITRTDSGIDSIYQLQGKKIAYVDPASTSGYILPKAILQKLNIKPSEEVFGMKHDNVVTMIYQKQVDAGATYYSPPDKKTGEILDARSRVVKQFPDIYEKVKIIGFTEAIPNDPFVIRKDFPEEMKKKIVSALLEFQSTPEGRQALYDIYSVEGLSPATDADYEMLRVILAQQEVELEKLLKK